MCLKKLKTELSYDSYTSLLGIYTKMRNPCLKDIWVPTRSLQHYLKLFTIIHHYLKWPRYGNNLKYLSVNGKRTTCHIHDGTQVSLKMKEILPCAITWMNLQDVILKQNRKLDTDKTNIVQFHSEVESKKIELLK